VGANGAQITAMTAAGEAGAGHGRPASKVRLPTSSRCLVPNGPYGGYCWCTGSINTLGCGPALLSEGTVTVRIMCYFRTAGTLCVIAWLERQFGLLADPFE
jgi:hypothetical protein